jgi:hypothetical protein
MTTVFAQIVGAVIDRLQAAPAVCRTVYRARPNVVPDQVEQAINVQWDQASGQPVAIFGSPKDWSTRVNVECYARSLADSGDVAVDPLLQAVYERLAQDPTLAGLVSDMDCVGIEIETAQEAKKTGWVRLTYIVQHRTENGSLSA